jgi:hypothetical protein
MIDIKHDICVWKCLMDGTPDLTAIVSCDNDRDFYSKLLTAMSDTIECFLNFGSCVSLA